MVAPNVPAQPLFCICWNGCRGDSDEGRETRRHQLIAVTHMAGSRGLPTVIILQVLVNLPPEVAAGQDRFLVTCEYTPGIVRRTACSIAAGPRLAIQSTTVPPASSLFLVPFTDR